MAEFDNTNKGVLFVNNRKEKDTQPDWTGKIDVNGTEYYLSGWSKKKRDNEDFFSLAVGKAVEERQTETARRSPPVRSQPAAGNRTLEDMDDDIPF